MTRQEQNKLLKEYKEYLLKIKQYQLESVPKGQELAEELNSYDKPKVLVLKRKYYGKELKVA